MFLIKKLFVQRIGLVGITNLILGLRTFVIVPILTKTLSTYEYGIWAQIVITISLLMPFATLGLRSSMGRFLGSKKTKQELRDAFYTILTLVIMSSVIVLLCIYLLADTFTSILLKNVLYLPVVQVTAYIIALTAINQSILSYFTAVQHFKKYSFYIILENVVELVLISYAVITGYGIFGAIKALFIAQIIMLLIMGVPIVLDLGLSIPSFSNTKKYVKFGLPMISTVIFAWIIHSSDQYMISYFTDSEQVGIYAVSYTLGYAIKVLMDSIGLVLYPTVSKLWDESNYTGIKVYMNYSLRYFMMLSIPAACGLTVLSTKIIPVFSTSDYIAGSIIVPYVTTGLIFYSLYSYYSKILSSSLRTDLIAAISATMACLNIILNFILIPIYGILGAAIATFITYMLAGLLTLFISNKYLKLEMDLNFILKSIIASLIMSVFIVLFNPNNIIEISLSILLGIVVYSISLGFLKGYNAAEYNLVRSAIEFVK